MKILEMCEKEMEEQVTANHPSPSESDLYQISSFLTAMRKEQGLTLDYAKGLCEKGELSKIENGEHIPPKLLLEALLERLGVSLEYHGVIYNERTYELEQKRNTIQFLLNHGFREKAQQMSKELEQKLQSFAFPEKKPVWKLWKQFFCHVDLCLQLEKGTPVKELKGGALAAIRLTVPDFPDGLTPMIRYDKEELSLLCFYGELLWREKKQEESLQMFSYLCDYAWKKIPDRMEQVKVYPGLLWMLTKKKQTVGQSIDGIYANALKILREEHKCFFLEEWIELRKKEGQRDTAYKSYMTDEILALRGNEPQPGSREFRKVEKEVGKLFRQLNQKEKQFYFFCREEGYKSFANYQILSRCHQEDMTKEMLATEEIVTSRTLSRLEDGEKLHPSTYQLLMERFGAKGDYYQPVLKTNDLSLFQTRRRLILHMEQKDFLAAEGELELLKRGLDQREAINRQAILFYQVIMDKRRKRREREELLADLEKALHLTLPEGYDVEHYPLSQIEARILNQMALLENRVGNTKKAIQILQSMRKSFEHNPLGKEADMGGYFLLMSNLVNYLGDVGEYEECIKYSKEVIQDAYQTGRGYNLILALYDKAWCVERFYSDRDTRDACLRELKQAFSLAVLMEYRYMRNLIEDYCKNQYQISMEEWLKEEKRE